MPDLDELREGYYRRVRVRVVSVALSLPLFWFFLSGLLDLASGTNQVPVHSPLYKASFEGGAAGGSTFLSQIGKMKDTLYTTKPNILEIRLDEQMLYIHRRDSATMTMKVSTGTERLEKGITTRKGVFLVQNKIEWLYSVQFDSTKVFNWLGFNWGVGFHSLLGNRYYRYLGRRPSSHGCVRVGRDNAKQLYNMVTVGTPVLVSEGDAARVVAFLPDSCMIDTTHYSNEEVRSIYSARLKDLYDGNRLFRNYPTILLDRQYVGHQGVPIGSLDRVPNRQKVPPISTLFYQCKPAKTSAPHPHLKRWVDDTPAMEKEKVEQSILP